MTQCCNTQKVKRIAITAFIVVVMAFVFCNLFTVQAHAAGLLDETIDATHEFSKYSINNYQLDFYVDTSWDWLPWNWKDGLGKTVQYAFYMFTNLIWTMNLYMSNAVGYLIQQAYDLDFISSAADTVGTNIQLITGISPSGFDTTGLFPGMIALITLMVGLYCIYAACVKHEITKALHAALNYAVVFIASFCLIAYAPSAIKGLNEFSSDISNGVINASAKILAPDATNTSTGVATIRDCLFGIQVKQPWLLMQFDDTDVETIGEERVNDLLGTSPKTNKGEDREEVVKSEIEDYDNGNLTITEVNNRLGLSFVFLIFNIIISIFAIALAGSMLLSQVLFLINAMFLPISLLISMIPAFSGTSKRAVVSLFNTIMLRVGTTLLTDALTVYLTEDLQRMTNESVKSDVAVSSSVQNVQIWSVEQIGGSESDFEVVFTVTQTISDGTKKDSISGSYETAVHKDSSGDMVITQTPTITAKPGKSDYEPERVEPNGTVSSDDTKDITDFLNTFFALYPTATEKELTYYVSGDSMPPIKCADYTFTQLKNTVLRKDGESVKANVSVEYADAATQMTQISQFELTLKKVDGNWKIVG